MAKRVEITEEMVERAYQESFAHAYCSSPRAFCRKILEAALNPKPAVPEIVVTEEMLAAAKIAAPSWWWGDGVTKAAVAVYRAMRALEPGVSGQSERRKGERRVYNREIYSRRRLLADRRKPAK